MSEEAGESAHGLLRRMAEAERARRIRIKEARAKARWAALHAHQDQVRSESISREVQDASRRKFTGVAGRDARRAQKKQAKPPVAAGSGEGARSSRREWRVGARGYSWGLEHESEDSVFG